MRPRQPSFASSYTPLFIRLFLYSYTIYASSQALRCGEGLKVRRIYSLSYTRGLSSFAAYTIYASSQALRCDLYMRSSQALRCDLYIWRSICVLASLKVRSIHVWLRLFLRCDHLKIETRRLQVRSICVGTYKDDLTGLLEIRRKHRTKSWVNPNPTRRKTE